MSQAELTPPEAFFGVLPQELSDGQRQRVVVAGALALEPSYLVADEPVASLDASVRGEILALLLRLKRDLGLGALVITHDLGLAWNIADRVMVMHHGRIVEDGTVEQVLLDPHDDYSQPPQLARIPARERDLAAPRRPLDLEGQLVPVGATGDLAVLDPRADVRHQLVGPADRAHPVGVEDHLVAIGGQRLRAPGRPQLTLGQPDRTIVHLLGLPERPLGGGDLVVLLAHKLPQRPSSNLDGLTLALRSRHKIHTSPSLGLTRARPPHSPRGSATPG